MYYNAHDVFTTKNHQKKSLCVAVPFHLSSLVKVQKSPVRKMITSAIHVCLPGSLNHHRLSDLIPPPPFSLPSPTFALWPPNQYNNIFFIRLQHAQLSATVLVQYDD